MSTSGSSRAGTPTAVRAAAVAAARELERRHPDLITAAWWKEERGRRVFVDFNQNAPHKTVFGAVVGAGPARRPGVGARSVGRARRDPPDDLTIATVPARLVEQGDPWATSTTAAVARAAARAARARPGRRPARRAVAARLPEEAGRATARRAEPRPQGHVTSAAARRSTPATASGTTSAGRPRRARRTTARATASIAVPAVSDVEIACASPARSAPAGSADAKTVTSRPSPSEPPSWCATFTTPDAAPASSLATPATPAVVSGVNARLRRDRGSSSAARPR